MSNNTQQVVLVTGCSEGGIGYEMCKHFARSGCRVFASARRLDAMNGLAEVGVELVQLDVNSADSRKKAVDDVITAAGHIDILVNNAGMGLVAPAAEMGLDAVRQLFETNVIGLLGMTQEVVPHMARHRCGKIVNIGSIVGYVAIPWSAAYSATKSAVHSLTDAMRLELTPLGIRVILVAPGVVQSKFGSKASSGVASIKQDTLYPADIVKAIQDVADQGAEAGATPVADFAQRAAAVILKPRPPRHWSYGQKAGLLGLLRWMPLWFVDRALGSSFGIKQ